MILLGEQPSQSDHRECARPPTHQASLHDAEPLLPHQHGDAKERFPVAEAAEDAGEDLDPKCDWEEYATRIRRHAEQRARQAANNVDKGEGELACVSGGTVNAQF